MGGPRAASNEVQPSRGKVHFLDGICPSNPVQSHQLNFLLQIIFHLPEASRREERKPRSHSRRKTDRPGFTIKRKSKCFYFKIYHLQLSSKFVSPFVAHFQPPSSLFRCLFPSSSVRIYLSLSLSLSLSCSVGLLLSTSW